MAARDPGERLRALDRQIAAKENEIRAAKQAAREARSRGGTAAGGKGAQGKAQAPDRSRSTQLRELDREIARKQRELSQARAQRNDAAQSVGSPSAGEELDERIEERTAQLAATNEAERGDVPPADAPSRSRPPTRPRVLAGAARRATEAVKRGREETRRQQAEREEERPPVSPHVVRLVKSPARPARGALRPGTAQRVAIVAGIVAVAAAAGLVSGAITTGDSPAPATPEANSVAAGYERAVRQELRYLAAARGAAMKKLREANTPARQAAASRRLAALHHNAASVLRRAPVPNGGRSTNRALVAALGEVAEGYRRLGRAAADGGQAAYRSAVNEVLRTESVLREALATTRSGLA